MTFEEELVLLARGIEALSREANTPAPSKPSGKVIDLLTRRENLIQCMQDLIFKHFGERKSDDPQVPHNPDFDINQWGN